MDYTLALYKSPQYEILAFNLVVDQLLKLGYPKDIKNFVYDPTFPVRGLWYDKLYGNLLKTDSYGNILVCVHGFKFLKSNEKKAKISENLFCFFFFYFIGIYLEYLMNNERENKNEKILYYRYPQMKPTRGNLTILKIDKFSNEASRDSLSRNEGAEVVCRRCTFKNNFRSRFKEAAEKNKTKIQEKDQPTSDPVKPTFAIVTISSH